MLEKLLEVLVTLVSAIADNTAALKALDDAEPAEGAAPGKPRGRKPKAASAPAAVPSPTTAEVPPTVAQPASDANSEKQQPAEPVNTSPQAPAGESIDSLRNFCREVAVKLKDGTKITGIIAEYNPAGLASVDPSKFAEIRAKVAALLAPAPEAAPADPFGF